MQAACTTGSSAGGEAQTIFVFGMQRDSGQAKRIARHAGDVFHALERGAPAGTQAREASRKFSLKFRDFEREIGKRASLVTRREAPHGLVQAIRASIPGHAPSVPRLSSKASTKPPSN